MMPATPAPLCFLSCTLSRLRPIWKPFITLMACVAEIALSYETKPKPRDRPVREARRAGEGANARSDA